MQRPVRSPSPGELVITEIMVDPQAAGDEVGEWFEIAVLADVDLNGITVASDSAAGSISGTACLEASAGAVLVVARHGDPGSNGGIAADLVLQGAFTLANVGGSLRLALSDTLLDEITWTSSTSGVARQLDPSATHSLLNDDDSNWCEATTAYGSGDLGTPGEPNPACP